MTAWVFNLWEKEIFRIPADISHLKEEPGKQKKKNAEVETKYKMKLNIHILNSKATRRWLKEKLFYEMQYNKL